MISKTENKEKIKIEAKEKEELTDVAKRTWAFFDTYMNAENNFLPPDNYQERRKFLVTRHTSSTNIGLRTSFYYIC